MGLETYSTSPSLAGGSRRCTHCGSLAALVILVLVAITVAGCADSEALPELSGSGGGTSNNPPSASFTTSCAALSCNFDAGASADSDGSIASYAWDFGDGASATGATANHVYGADGSYAVTLTITDDAGATATSSQTASVAAGGGGNNPPSASLSASCTDLACSFDASASADSDGTIASYDWDFGDGAIAAGVTTNHAYASAGSYTVTLSVTDNVGAVSTASQSLTLSTGGGALDGQTLYQQNCSTCHGADATGGSIAKISIVGKTAAEITTAIDTVNNMSSLQSLTAEQIHAIADFLGTLLTGTVLTETGNTWSKLTLVDGDGTTVNGETDPNTGGYLLDGSAFSGAILAKAYFPTEDRVLYGYVDQQGVLNITPLTDQVLSLASGGRIGSECFDGSGTLGACLGTFTIDNVLLAQLWVAEDLADLFAEHDIATGVLWMNLPFDFGDGGMATLIGELSQSDLTN